VYFDGKLQVNYDHKIRVNAVFLRHRTSDQLEPKRAAHDLGGTLKGGDCHVSVLRVEKAADLAAACLHAFGKAFSRKVLCLHCLTAICHASTSLIATASNSSSLPSSFKKSSSVVSPSVERGFFRFMSAPTVRILSCVFGPEPSLHPASSASSLSCWCKRDPPDRRVTRPISQRRDRR
jgi:hypothetical protein